MSKIFALSDLHLSLYKSKPMDGFGENWHEHHKKIAAHWREKVQADDFVLLAGDTSWAMTEEEAAPDLNFIENLPGYKILVKGNHDFWWGSASRLNENYQTMRFLQNDFFLIEELNVAVCGARGWICPNDSAFTPHDEKIYRREAGRLERSLTAAEAHLRGGADKIVMLHYPPTSGKREQTSFTNLIERHAVSAAVYGHLHLPGTGAAFKPPIEGMVNGTEYFLTSADYLGFEPVRIR